MTRATQSSSVGAFRVLASAAAVLAACGAQSSHPPAAPERPAPQSSGADQSQLTAASTVRPDELRGTWVEYWAVDGGADTERYSFSELGRFEWHSAHSAHSAHEGQQAPQTAVRKAGVFRVERNGTTPVLVLEVQHESFAACAAPCTSADETREVDHATPLVEQVELGECPSNPEAQRIDASYTCRAFGGKAFWRKPLDARAATAEPSAG